jgi:protoporphyrin/coproporphyrin ferrochelatase
VEENKSHKYFLGTRNFSHRYTPATGVLLLNLGTPDAPDRKALRRYLKEFLSDVRIIELPKIFWQLLLRGIVLNTRPQKVAKLYQSIWTEEGSPLLVYTKSLGKKLETALRLRLGSPVHLACGMRYGNPSVKSALQELKEKGCVRIIFIPLFGQYSSTTVGSGFDAFATELMTWRWVPDIRTVHYFHDHPGYISALAKRVTSHWEEHGRGEKLLMSFHGVPKRYIEAGDPYSCHCRKTARLLAEALGIDESAYHVAFQSQFGKEEWIKPATDQTLIAWAKAGMKKVDVICPGFLVDCLETIEEIAEENKENFLHNGGEIYHYIPSLNDGDDFVSVLEDICLEHGSGWLIPKEEWNVARADQEAQATDIRFMKLAGKE